MIGQDILFSKKSNDWETPVDLFNKLNEYYNFDIDVCCTEQNKKCAVGITKKDDGLIQSWTRFYEENQHSKSCAIQRPLIAWMNPPYKDIKLWLAKAIVMAEDEDISTVCLLPARTDTKWFHEFLYHGKDDKKYIQAVRFLKGRLKFVGAKSSAPFPSMIATIQPLGLIFNSIFLVEL